MTQRDLLLTARAGSADVDLGVAAMLVAGEVIEGGPEPALDRWTRALARTARAQVTGLLLTDGARRFVASLYAGGGSAGPVRDLADGLTLSSFLRAYAGSPARPDPPSSCPNSLLEGSNGRPEGSNGRPEGSNGNRAEPLYAELPVLVAGIEIGLLGMTATGRPAWTGADLAALEETARAISVELGLRAATGQAARVQALVRSHGHVHDMIGRGVPVREVLTEICRTVERYDPSLVPCILLVDSSSGTLHSAVGPALPPDYLAAMDGLVIGPNLGTCGPAAWFGRLTVSPNLAEDPRWAPSLGLAEAAGVAHCWSMPIKAAEGEVIGTLAFYGRAPREPLPEHLDLLTDWAQVAGIAIERGRTLDRLTHDARHDGLTGLPNRRAIFEELDQAIERVTPERAVAVLFLDLDGLKVLNDTLGHDRADEVIREVARRLAQTARAVDFVGRFGGDEFIVLSEDVRDPQEAATLAARLLAAVAVPLPGPHAGVVTASIGIALVRSSAVETRAAIRTADEAMYLAKRSGRDRYVFAEADTPPRAGRRLQLARALRGAETRGEMCLEFQPVVALPTREIVGVEALLRWTPTAFTAVPPAEFIPIAEDSGTIVSLGTWALRESCETMAALAERGHKLTLDVNVSALQLAHPDFPLWVRQILAHADVPAPQLGLEITETVLVRPDGVTAQNLRALDALGVRVILDDFGTGFSSLSSLKQHPIAGIKIDRSFVGGLPDDANDQAIVSALIGLADGLGCTVTAEGVETEPQVEALTSLGCPLAQGFLLARPLPVDRLASVLGHRAEPA